MVVFIGVKAIVTQFQVLASVARQHSIFYHLARRIYCLSFASLRPSWPSAPECEREEADLHYLQAAWPSKQSLVTVAG